MFKEYKMLINGKWLPGKEKINITNPYNDEVIGTVPKATKKDVDNAIMSAQQAFKVISTMDAYKRSEILENTSTLLQKHREDIIETLIVESGKPWKYANGEIGRAIETFKFAAEEAKQISGETIPFDASPNSTSKLGFYFRTPIGVIGAISPFNFPLNLVAHKIAPAIASGNSVVLKPATATPITALKLGELLLKAGLPDGVLNIILGEGSSVGDWLVTDPRIKMITFTGSPSVGKYIMSRGGLKKYTMELGSNSAVIVCEDADLTKAIPRCMVGSFAYSGQVCISVQRIYVHQNIFKEFTEQFKTETTKQKIGNPIEQDCDIGPMIDIREAQRAYQWVQKAIDSGAKILAGGKLQGKTFPPTILTDVKHDMNIIQKEIFAPVVSIIPYSDFDEALELVDSTKYGLQAGIYTNDIERAFKAVKRINVGGIIINDIPTFRVDHMPYGGNKDSGIGREGLKYAIDEMTNIKLVCFNL